MCDYCGCRTRLLLAQLAGDHERILTAIHELRTATDTGDAETQKRLARGLVAVLEVHGALEEAVLYPELACVGVPTEVMETEHADVHAALRAAARAARVDRPAVAAALRCLEDHIHREEYDLFPAAHQLLDDVAWDRIHANPLSGGGLGH